MYNCGRFMLMYGKTNTIFKIINLQLNKFIFLKKLKKKRENWRPRERMKRDKRKK